MAKYLQLATEAIIFSLAALLAWILRHGPDYALVRLQDIEPYLLISLAAALLVFHLFRLHLHFYRFFSFHDLVQIVLAVSLAVLLVVLLSFAIFRLEAIQRSLPFMHWLFAIIGIVTVRVAGMVLGLHREGRGRVDRHDGHVPTLIIGYTPTAEICLRTIPAFGKESHFVVGILDESSRRLGQRLRYTRVIGHPAELGHVISDMAIHGVVVRKVILACRREDLSHATRQVLADLEQDGQIEVHDFHRHVAAFFEDGPVLEEVHPPLPHDALPLPERIRRLAEQRVASYGPFKRAFDILLALLLGLIMSPVMLILVPLIRLSIGGPVYFWQERPGRGGRIFRLYKLRTLLHGVDENGEIIADADRQTRLGRFLRRTRLDEIPQLYNVLIGDMSFVGPRPLLPIDLPADLPSWARLRSLVRPGLTGWAQINGGQAVSKEDKVVLDVWYLVHMSLWTDLRMIWGTVKVVLKGEKLDHGNICASYEDLGVECPTDLAR